MNNEEITAFGDAEYDTGWYNGTVTEKERILGLPFIHEIDWETGEPLHWEDLCVTCRNLKLIEESESDLPAIKGEK